MARLSHSLNPVEVSSNVGTVCSGFILIENKMADNFKELFGFRRIKWIMFNTHLDKISRKLLTSHDVDIFEVDIEIKVMY